MTESHEKTEGEEMTEDGGTTQDTSDTKAEAEARLYRVAGLVYLVLGTLVLLVTVASPGLASPERRADIAHLLVGVPIFLLFAAAIAWGHRVLGHWLREKLVMLMTLTSLGRTGVFLSNALGLEFRLAGGLRIDRVEPSPRAWINFVLMVVIVTLLARASWGPFLGRLRGGSKT